MRSASGQMPGHKRSGKQEQSNLVPLLGPSRENIGPRNLVIRAVVYR